MLPAAAKAAFLATTENLRLAATTFRFVSDATLGPDGSSNVTQAVSLRAN